MKKLVTQNFKKCWGGIFKVPFIRELLCILHILIRESVCCLAEKACILFHAFRSLVSYLRLTRESVKYSPEGLLNTSTFLNSDSIPSYVVFVLCVICYPIIHNLFSNLLYWQLSKQDFKIQTDYSFPMFFISVQYLICYLITRKSNFSLSYSFARGQVQVILIAKLIVDLPHSIVSTAISEH